LKIENTNENKKTDSPKQTIKNDNNKDAIIQYKINKIKYKELIKQLTHLDQNIS
jgi:hypothetical protein